VRAETPDFKQDFVDAVRANTTLVRMVDLRVGYLTGCMRSLGSSAFFPPIQIEAGSGRANDEQILLEALIRMRISKKQITIKESAKNDFLQLTIGPKSP
jgi:hypothetical protein